MPFLQPSRRAEVLAKLSYFLQHAASLEVETRDGKMRLVDAYMAGEETPLALACRFRQPAIVLLLLRHGARTELPYARHQFSDCLEVLLTSLYFVHTTENDHENVEKSLQYICRSAERISMKRLEHRLADNMYKPSHPSWREIIPSRRHKDPAELQHLCRCNIRRQLHKSFSLPNGIEKLPLPNRLKKYLDLEFD
ncbi:ankyrin repeat and SOCS box protein 17-like [Lineus longissimus]|uniref:ankyrin repeat and SOCS box protein 17-like n=1 Tax=Lineus longissimus TaxID=88925 RepID=UPI00315CAFC8